MMDIFSVGKNSLLSDKPKNIYRLFGVNLASDYVFANPLPKVSGVPEVSFTCSSSSPCLVDWMKKPVHTSRFLTDDGETVLSIYAMDDCHVCRFAGLVDFYLFPDSIIAHPHDPVYSYMIETLLLGEIFSLWLELKGIRMIHASAIVIDNDAVAFLSFSTGGKSSLAAAFAQQGHLILTDDLLPVEKQHNLFLGRPGYPAMRMWPDQAVHFLGSYEDLECVRPEYAKRRVVIGPHRFGTFCSDEKPLKVMYIPRRLPPGSEISIEPISKKNAFFVLLQNSFSAGIVEALGLHPQRMDFFARMVTQVPVRRLNYPEGFDRLSHVVDAVLDDIESL
jgi:hypothetical protein